MERITIKKMVIPIEGYRAHTLTCYDENDERQIWIFDDCVDYKPMNNRDTNQGGFLESRLCEWLNTSFKMKLPEEIQYQVEEIRIPCYHEIFGDNYSFGLSRNDILPDGVDPIYTQYPLMKDRRYRTAGSKDGNHSEWYWLADPIVRSATTFAHVNTTGYALSNNASNSNGVWPVLPINLESLISATSGGGIELYEIEEILF